MNVFKTAIAFIITCLAVSAAQARTVAYVCEASNQTTLNRFSSSGSVEVSGSKAEGEFSATYALGGRGSHETGSLEAKGTVRVIPAGQFGVNEVTIIKMQARRDENRKPVHMSLNLGIHNATSSTLTIDGIPYLAHCYEAE